MKINRLETHDRYQHFTNQNFDISECCQNLIDQRPFGTHPFYIFAHPRTADDGVSKRLIWQPRLTRPVPQTNSMLFKAYPGTDIIKTIWMIPDRAMWKQYDKGNVCDSEIIRQSIFDFTYNRELLAKKEPDDMPDWQIDNIYRELSNVAKQRKINVRIEKN